MTVFYYQGKDRSVAPILPWTRDKWGPDYSEIYVIDAEKGIPQRLTHDVGSGNTKPLVHLRTPSWWTSAGRI